MPTMPPEKLSQKELDQLKTYFEVMVRYRELSPAEGLPWIGVRLLMIRHGLRNTLNAITKWGEDIVADRAVDELRNMARLWFKQVAADPPSSDKYDGVMQNIHLIWTSTRDPAVRDRVFQIVARLRIREDTMQQAQRDTLRRTN